MKTSQIYQLDEKRKNSNSQTTIATEMQFQIKFHQHLGITNT